MDEFFSRCQASMDQFRNLLNPPRISLNFEENQLNELNFDSIETKKKI